MPYPAPIDPEHINITALNIDALTKAWATVTMPAGIDPNQCGSLRCKVNTGTSSNVMPLCIFAKLFPRCITRDGKPTGLQPCDTILMAYNGSNIPQFGALDTAIALKASPDQIVCSRQSWTSHTWPSFLIKTWNCLAELHGQTHQQMGPTQPTQQTYNRMCLGQA